MLSVTCVVHREPSKRGHLILFAGDTAGRVTVWDVTQDIINYIKEVFDADDVTMKGPLERVFQEEYNRGNSNDKHDTPTEHEEVLLSNACSNCELVVEEKTDNAVKHTHLTKSTHELQCKESMQSLEGSEIIESSCCKEHVCREDPTDNVSVEELQGKSFDCSNCIQEVLSSVLNDNKSVSCVPVVGSMLKPPLTVFAAHQSGVNKLSVVSQENGKQSYNLQLWLHRKVDQTSRIFYPS